MRINKLIKQIIKILPNNIQRDIFWQKNRLTRKSKIKKWEATGCPLPPPHQYKQLTVEKVAERFNLKYFVETGTFLGHMIEAQRNNFLRLYSIEVEPILCKNAKTYFAPYPHIKIVEGDSAVKLKGILSEIPGKAILFWLDGHYSGENTGKGYKQCPIFDELDSIFKQQIIEKYIMIDDARCFNGTNDYPTINELSSFIREKECELKIQIINDIIHIN